VRYWHAGEDPILLRDVHAAMTPPVSPCAPYRWAVAGCAGVRLRKFKLTPSLWATTKQELARFLAAITAIRGGDA
jgi:hypothetical protein